MSAGPPAASVQSDQKKKLKAFTAEFAENAEKALFK